MVFPLKFGNEVKTVSKIEQDEFSPLHREILTQAQYEQRNLAFPDERWRSVYLGAGEEKAVFCVCDHNDRVFALEAIDERHYLNGRFVGGEYFFNARIGGLVSQGSSGALIGMSFTGLAKIREFVYGYEWARFQFSPEKRLWIDRPLTAFLRSALSSQFNGYRQRYKDVHDRNVMFEIRTLDRRGVPAVAQDWCGKVQLIKVGLQPIDVR